MNCISYWCPLARREPSRPTEPCDLEAQMAAHQSFGFQYYIAFALVATGEHTLGELRARQMLLDILE